MELLKFYSKRTSDDDMTLIHAYILMAEASILLEK